MLRDFSWRYFSSTGDIHAYLLYREHLQTAEYPETNESDSTPEELGESQACL